MTKVRVYETHASTYSVAIEVGAHSLIGDEPADKGGLDLGPSPYDLLTSALGECTAMTVRWYARSQGWPVDQIEVRVVHEKRGRQDVFTKSVHITGDLLSDDQRVKLIEVASKCPVQRALLASDTAIETVPDIDIPAQNRA
ncbi:OsmC family protein [Asticcacaulis sp. ZE23SCel15]|uniref:OsmC family protein n=1 Tax=Asticcacaulis sp. ZE23SCel15 TaxID=3059027 RepID=UPI0026604F2A|nr:OsmC family protein [Asticcacaulis sp. ZE23SCel15]WKL56231.1 OsmC family protein [Asticcacaulis sp. ZE23SCel15]